MCNQVLNKAYIEISAKSGPFKFETKKDQILIARSSRIADFSHRCLTVQILVHCTLTVKTVVNIYTVFYFIPKGGKCLANYLVINFYSKYFVVLNNYNLILYL